MPHQFASSDRETRRRLAAELVYDTGTQPLPRGLRTVGHRSRCLFLTADDFEVMLEVQREGVPEQRALAGSVMKEGLPLTGALIRLEGPARRTVARTDADGVFRWSGLPPGDYALEVEDGQDLIALPGLSLDAA